jgi:predicted NAD/FAD-binding protein
LADGRARRHDVAVVATHADEAYALLADPSAEETRLLSPWRYSANRVILHSDPGWMPTNRRAWASWNYYRTTAGCGRAPITLTYHMNRLQNLETRRPYFVTLNPPAAIAARDTVAVFDYHHPMYTFACLASQADLPSLNGRRRTYFCGSYHGYGFHEDAVRSAVAAAAALGGRL